MAAPLEAGIGFLAPMQTSHNNMNLRFGDFESRLQPGAAVHASTQTALNDASGHGA